MRASTRWLLALLAGLVSPAVAQIQLFQFNGTTETAVGSIYQLPVSAPGDVVETRFRVHNNGNVPVTLATLSLAGANFKISAAPSLGTLIPVASFAEFRVQFAPDGTGGYSANLQVNSITALLRATVVAAPTILLGSTTLPSGATIDFGSLQWGKSATQTLTLSNPNSTPVSVSSIAVTGSAFQGPGGIAAPLTLSPGQALAFPITFAPLTAQTFQGTLKIDQRSWQLTGLALNPPLPAASIQLSSTTATSGQQPTLSIPLAAASQVAGSGTLTMNFTPAVSSLKDDPAVMFLSGPLRTATVTVAAGDSVARIGTNGAIPFQTGTTAGTILFTLKLGGTTQQASVAIAPSPVSFQTTTGTRRVGDLDISLIGFDNTQSASMLKFTFYDASGSALSPGVITADVSKNFQTYFTAGVGGGAFALLATFPVSGDSSVVSAVDIEMTNSQGVTKTSRISF